MTRRPETKSDTGAPSAPPSFDATFRASFTDLLRWRRDIRHFCINPVPDDVLEDALQHAVLAPSVGHSQPWRFVAVETPTIRQKVIADFNTCNHAALAGYEGERAKLYASLKLSGLCEAPVQLAVFCDMATEIGHGLGRKTMPETLIYSVVAAIQNLWLAARVRGLGVGWVSILDPDAITKLLDVPTAWHLVAYLCIGYPQEDHLDPELERAGWQARVPQTGMLYRR
jgi:5,6-dimethylbenzimidazole synthase